MTEHLDHTYQVMRDFVADPEAASPQEVVGRLMHANLLDHNATVKQLYELQQERIADLEAQLAAIRHRVQELYSGPYMPSAQAILSAVFAPREALQQQMRVEQQRGVA